MCGSLSTRRRGGILGVLSLLVGLVGLVGCGGGGGGAQDSPTAPSVSAESLSPVATADPGSPLPAQWHRGAFMQIFVRAYQDSDGDGIGDLKGLTSQLDQLQELGVSGLWLMPIHPSQDRDHGYAVTDYRAVAPEYGTLADLDELLRQAHARGMGVILDCVMNHSGATHPLFAQSRSAADNAWREWYVWQSASTPSPGSWRIYGSNPWYNAASNGGGTGTYFAGFWSQMPDFNLKNPTVAAWHRDNLRFWLNRGVDGFRFDAVGNLVENGPNAWEHQPENHVLMAATRQVLADYQQRYMVCEAPSLPLRYAEADSCGSSFAFGHQYDLIAAAKGDTAAIARVAAYRNSVPDSVASFASNHDSFAGERVWDQLGGDPARLRLLAASYLLSSPTAFIYYGEEIGMAGAASLSGDAKLRTPMSWRGDTRTAGFTTGTPFRALSANVSSANVDAQRQDPSSLRSFYRDMLSLRKQAPALTLGRYTHASAQGSQWQFRRVWQDPAQGSTSAPQTVWVVFNHGTAPTTVTSSAWPAGQTLERLWPKGSAVVLPSTLQADGQSTANVTLPALSVSVWRTP